MSAHLRANLWLLVLTVLLCCVFYPFALWLTGLGFFADKASGSLIDKDGKPTLNDTKAVGSRLIAQPFNGPEYFQPRPSSPSWDASASGGSNFSANNPKLRARVAQALGPIVKYRSGPKKDQLAGKDIEQWFQHDHFKGKPHILAQWAEANDYAAQAWVKADKLNSDFVTRWQSAHAKEVEEWVKKKDIAEPKTEDLAVPFFISFSHTYPGSWPGTVENKTADGKMDKHIEPVTEDASIQQNFFAMWRQEHPDVELVEVPADMVMASGSGLDPHITLKNARYQLDRVVDAWAEKTKADKADVRKAIENLLKQKAAAPFGGLAGVELINVLEVNLALPDLIERLPRRTARGGGSA